MRSGFNFQVSLVLALLALGVCFPRCALSEAQTIRDIRIEVRPVFDDQDIGRFYELVNQVKIATRREVVSRELLFEEGDPLDEFVLQESERALRVLPFVRQVSITPIPDGDFVDILVSVQDTWTIFPQFGFSSGGGTDKLELGLLEENLLGYGKLIELTYADDEGRETFSGRYDDLRLFGSYHRMTLGQLVRSDGYRTFLFAGRPFRSLLEDTSWSVNADFSDLVNRLFKNGDERFLFRNRHREASARYVRSRGDPEVLLHRYSFGYEYLENEFELADEQDFEDVDVNPNSVSRDPALVAENRAFSGPFFVYDRIEPDFLSINYIDRFERIEDFNLGNVFSARLQAAADILGSRRDTLLATFSNREGAKLGPTEFIRGEIGAASRLDHRGLENTIIRGELRYYNVLGAEIIPDLFIGKHTLAVNLQMDYGDDLDRDREFLLGATNGLRGYEDRTFTGDKRAILNIEDRFHFAEDVLRLFSLGGVFFVDVGGSTTRSFGRLLQDEMYGDVGFGLRIGVPRTSGGSVIRIDVAFPWRDGPDETKAWEPRLFITTGQLFSSRLRSESVGAEQANVGLGEAN